MTHIDTRSATNCQPAGNLPAALGLLLCLCLAGTSTGWGSPAFQSPASIRATVEGFLQGRFGAQDDTEFKVGRLDPRLRLRPCRTGLHAELPAQGRALGHTSVVVRCADPNGWKIHVAVRILRYANVLVARRSLPRGTYLQADDVRFERREISRLNHGFFTTLAEIRNMVTRRNLRRDQILTAAGVKPPRLIRRGEHITILARSGGLAIRVGGEALMDGRRGDRIRVRNSRSKRELQATVIAAGTVSVNM